MLASFSDLCRWSANFGVYYSRMTNFPFKFGLRTSPLQGMQGGNRVKRKDVY